MATYNIRLFGRFSLCRGETRLNLIDAPRLQELVTYLLLFRDRPHPRETLAVQFWSDQPAHRSKKYLRQALWQIQSAFAPPAGEGGASLLHSDPNWVALNAVADSWLDVDVVEFERACSLLQAPAEDLPAADVSVLTRAADLYHGDLLEGCYQDWCLLERERLQNMYLSLLDRLMDNCETSRAYAAGLAYGMRVLRFDRARESTHRRLMRLYDLSGQREQAMRQYQHCLRALKEDLDVGPSRRTVQLYEQIRAGLLEDHAQRGAPIPATGLTGDPGNPRSLPEMLGKLKYLHHMSLTFQEEIGEEILLIERAITELDSGLSHK
jgi:DNA-binding SARP family transcriptional activator